LSFAVDRLQPPGLCWSDAGQLGQRVSDRSIPTGVPLARSSPVVDRAVVEESKLNAGASVEGRRAGQVAAGWLALDSFGD